MGQTSFLSILNLRNIPRDSTLGSPAERLMSRQTRTAIPVCTELLQPTPKSSQQDRAQLLNKRLTLKHQYDKSRHPLQPLTEGQVVRMQTPKGYDQLGIVKERSKEPRSYVIQSNRRTYRRNRRHILPVAEQPPQLHTEDRDSFTTSHHTVNSAPLTHTHQSQTSHNQNNHPPPS